MEDDDLTLSEQEDDKETLKKAALRDIRGKIYLYNRLLNPLETPYKDLQAIVVVFKGVWNDLK